MGSPETQTYKASGSVSPKEPKGFGDVIRRERLERKMTQAELSWATGIDPTALSRIETGGPRKDLSCRRLAKIATAFGMSPEEIIAQAGFLEREEITARDRALADAILDNPRLREIFSILRANEIKKPWLFPLLKAYAKIIAEAA